MKRLRTRGILTFLAWLSVAAGAEAETEYEEPPVLKAEQFLPEEFLSGPYHRVETAVPTDGFSAFFTIQSDYGTYRTVSLEETTLRIHEIQAIAQIEALEQHEIATQAAVEGVTQPFLAVKNVITQPAETARNLGAGLGRWLKRSQLTLRKTATKAKELAQDAKESYVERKQRRSATKLAEQEVQRQAIARDEDPEAAVEAYRERQPAEESSELAMQADAQRQQQRIQWTKKQLRKAAYRHLGYDRARRNLAASLGVDPYSTNLALQERIDTVAWAAWVGAFGTSLALPSHKLSDAAQDINRLVWESHPKDLEVLNRKRLKDLGLDRPLIDGFFDNPFFSPSDRTAMIADLLPLEGVANRSYVLQLAQAAEEPLIASFYQRTTRRIAEAHDRWPIQRIISPSQILVAALSQAGDLLLILPVDHLAWTENLALLTRTVERGCQDAGFEGGIRLLTGGLTKRAQKELEDLGWSVESSLADGANA